MSKQCVAGDWLEKDEWTQKNYQIMIEFSHVYLELILRLLNQVLGIFYYQIVFPKNLIKCLY